MEPPLEPRSLIAVTAVGRDRPGIVAEVSGALFRLGCNLEETTMTRLRDQFAMLLLVRLPENLVPGALEREFSALGERLGLTLTRRPIAEGAGDLSAGATAEPSGAPYILRLYGADQPGIVHAVTSALAARGLNITDLNTRVLPGAGGPVYVLVLEVEAPDEATAEALRPELERLRRSLGVELTFAPMEPEVL